MSVKSIRTSNQRQFPRHLLAQNAMSGSDVLHTAPAWTMGHRSSSPHICSDDTGPGPGTYNPGVSLMTGLQCLKGRGAGFGTSGRLASYANSNPGAGDYDTDGGIRATRRRAASAGIRGRESHDPVRQQQPGPGHYGIPAPAATRPQPPAASISQRLPGSKDTERRPSPGDYDPSAFRAKSPLPVTLKHKRAVSAGDRPDSGHAVPGPGSYRPQDVSVNSRHYSLAGRRRPASTSALLPGPADYSPYLPAPTSAVSFSRAERQPPCHYEVRPSPGSYFSSSVMRRQAGFSPESLRRSAPSFSISCRSGTAFSSGSPGPGDFSPRDSQVRRSSPVFTIKGVTRKDHCVRSPSPDAYCPLSCVEADSRHASAPGISISQRRLQAFAVCVALPMQQCCNHPDCSNRQQMSELELVGGKSCVCGGCRVARYCSRECQVAHYKGWNKAVCKRLQQQL